MSGWKESQKLDYQPTGLCCACPERARYFQFINGTLFEYCYLCYIGLTPDKRQYNK